MLILALVALVVLLLLSAVSLGLAVQSAAMAAAQRDAAAARNLAEGATDMMEAWLREQTAPPAGAGDVHDLGTITLPSGKMWGYIWAPANNPTLWQKVYTIVGMGTDKFGHTIRTVILQVQQQSFALYSYFTNQEVSSIGGSTIWFIPQDQIVRARAQQRYLPHSVEHERDQPDLLQHGVLQQELGLLEPLHAQRHQAVGGRPAGRPARAYLLHRHHRAAYGEHPPAKRGLGQSQLPQSPGPYRPPPGCTSPTRRAPRSGASTSWATPPSPSASTEP